MNKKKVTLFELTSDEAGQLFKKTKTLLMPFGSVEQHGPHVPLGLDGMDAYVVAKRIAEKIPAVIAPLLPVGISHYHMSWPGTITVKTETYAKFVEEMTLSLIQHGARNIVYINGHGGNKPGLDLAATNVQMATDARIMIVLCYQTPLVLFGGKLDMGHGGRIETNAVLAYDPDLVDLTKVETKPGWEEEAKKIARMRGRDRGDIYSMVKDFGEVSKDGWFGDAKSANVEEAKMMIDKVADEIIVYMKKTFGEIA